MVQSFKCIQYLRPPTYLEAARQPQRGCQLQNATPVTPVFTVLPKVPTKKYRWRGTRPCHRYFWYYSACCIGWWREKVTIHYTARRWPQHMSGALDNRRPCDSVTPQWQWLVSMNSLAKWLLCNAVMAHLNGADYSIVFSTSAILARRRPVTKSKSMWKSATKDHNG